MSLSTDDSFAVWYSLYPRKVARKAAEKAWARIVLPASPFANKLVEQIMVGLRAQLPAMLKQERKFVPYPATWLNQKRFEDEIDAAKIRPRVIACPECGDTGVIYDETWGDVNYSRCSCSIGQLPGALAGIAE